MFIRTLAQTIYTLNLIFLLDFLPFVRVDLVVCLINRYAFTTCTGWNTSNLWRLDDTHVVVDSSNAVIVCIADVNFDVATALVV